MADAETTFVLFGWLLWLFFRKGKGDFDSPTSLARIFLSVASVATPAGASLQASAHGQHTMYPYVSQDSFIKY
jgi:hypothetical protein